MTNDRVGWGWFESAARHAETDGGGDIAIAFARCFRGADGERALAYLKSLTVDRVLGPGASDAVLRHLEGQRALVVHLIGLVERGRHGALVPPTTKES